MRLTRTSAVRGSSLRLSTVASLYPLSGGFVYYASRFVDPALGMAVGWTYFYELAVTLPAEITAGSIVISYWDTTTPVAVWVTMFLVVIATTNFLGARVFGEVEFWLASLKVLTAVGLIILGIVIDLGGAPGHDRLGFRYWIGAYRVCGVRLTSLNCRFAHTRRSWSIQSIKRNTWRQRAIPCFRKQAWNTLRCNMSLIDLIT